MDCFGAYFTHVQACNVTRVQSATEWTASVHTLHMSKKHCYEPDNLHTKCTAVRLLKTGTWQPAHMEHTKYTAVRTKVYIQQNHSACTDEVLDRGYRWGPLTACTDEAVTLATLARTIRVYLRPWPRTIRVYLRPQKARAQQTPWPCGIGWHHWRIGCLDVPNMALV